MNNLSVISDAANIVSAVPTVMNVVGCLDTRKITKAANQLACSLETINDARSYINYSEFEGRDRLRAEALLDAFTIGAQNTIKKTLW